MWLEGNQQRWCCTITGSIVLRIWFGHNGICLIFPSSNSEVEVRCSRALEARRGVSREGWSFQLALGKPGASPQELETTHSPEQGAVRYKPMPREGRRGRKC